MGTIRIPVGRGMTNKEWAEVFEAGSKSAYGTVPLASALSAMKDKILEIDERNKTSERSRRHNE